MYLTWCAYMYMFACIFNLHSTDEMGKSNLVTAQREFKLGSPGTDSRPSCSACAMTHSGAEPHRTEEKNYREILLSPTRWLMMKYFCISSEPYMHFSHAFRFNKIVLIVLRDNKGRKTGKENEIDGNKVRGREGEYLCACVSVSLWKCFSLKKP